MWGKNAFICKIKLFMTVLGELPFSLVYYVPEIQICFGRGYEVMKHFLKGAAIVAAILIVLMGINIFLNTRGMELDATWTGVIAGMCGIGLYHLWIRNEEKK